MSRKSRRGITFRVTSRKPVNRLQVGDYVWVKDLPARIISVFVAQGKKAFKTDLLGLIFADEVEMK